MNTHPINTTNTRPIWSSVAGTDHSERDPEMRPRGNALVFPNRFAVRQIARNYRRARLAGINPTIARAIVWDTAFMATTYTPRFVGCYVDGRGDDPS